MPVPSAQPPAADGASPDPLDEGFTVPEAIRVSPRTRMLSYAGLATVLLLLVLAFLPAPYVIESPGPTFDTLGSAGSSSTAKPVIEISGAPTYATTGQLRLVTVLEAGGPGQATTLDRAVDAWFRSDTTLTPRDVLYPTGVTQKQEQQQASQDMVSSQDYATVAALTELGMPVPAKITVAGTVPGTGAAGVARKGDVITSVDGKTFTTYQQFTDALSAVEPGDTVTLGVKRGGKATDLKIKTTKGSDGQAVLGVYLVPTFTFPVKVTFNLQNVGGPSAGTMFALGIIDKMTKPDMANHQKIAGTGTMSFDGTVGAIGGIRQKMVGSRRDGATWFLAPESNCNDVVGNVPSGMHVVAMSTLHQARADVVAIGKGDGSKLPTCQGS